MTSLNPTYQTSFSSSHLYLHEFACIRLPTKYVSVSFAYSCGSSRGFYLFVSVGYCTCVLTMGGFELANEMRYLHLFAFMVPKELLYFCEYPVRFDIVLLRFAVFISKLFQLVGGE